MCYLYWLTILINSINLATGSLGMAIFRFICVKFQRFANDKSLAKKTIKKIMKAELFVACILAANAIFSTKNVGTNIVLEFATGRSKKMEMILERKTKEEMELGVNILTFNVMFYQFHNILELSLYLQLYFALREKSKLNTALTKTMKNQRIKRNSVTLLGQFLSFVLEILTSTTFLLLAYFDTKLAFYDVLQLISVALITMTHILSSPEIRRKYFWFDW